MGSYLKHPDGEIDYAIDWPQGFAGDGVTDSLWTVSPDELSGLTIGANDIDDRRTSARLAGGIAGHVYRITNPVTATSGETDARTIVICVEAR